MAGNSKFEKRKNLCGLGVSAVKKGYRRGAEALRGCLARQGRALTGINGGIN